VALAISPLTVACRTLSYFSQVANQPSRSRPYADLAPSSRRGGGRSWWAHLRSTPVNIGPIIPSEEIEDLLESGGHRPIY